MESYHEYANHVGTDGQCNPIEALLVDVIISQFAVLGCEVRPSFARAGLFFSSVTRLSTCVAAPITSIVINTEKLEPSSPLEYSNGRS